VSEILIIPDLKEAERVRKKLVARGVTWAGKGGPIEDLNRICPFVVIVENGCIRTMLARDMDFKDLNNTTLAKIPKIEPCVVIHHEVQEEGVLRLLDELGVRWVNGNKTSNRAPSREHPVVFPYALLFNSAKNGVYWTKYNTKPTLSTKDFMEAVKNAML
jgi:hypothetical protein